MKKMKGVKAMHTPGTRSEKSAHPPFLKKSKKKQPKVGRVERGSTHLPPYGIGTDMKQSPNY